MRVLLPDAYFEGKIATAELHAIFLRCIDGPHLLETEPLASVDSATGALVFPPKLQVWVDGQGKPWESIARIALEIGLRWSHAWQPKRTIRIVSRVDDWAASPHNLTPFTALRLLQLPLLVVLEDAVNDAHFVRAVTRTEFVAALTDAERMHWLEFSHGGGIGTAPRLVESWKSDPMCVCRRYVVFDSDARDRGHPSVESEKLRNGCAGAQIPHHQLERRSIENYIPIQALEQWAHRGLEPISQVPALTLMISLKTLPDDLRYFYNFKNGRSRDRRSAIPKAASDAWRKIPIAHRATLRTGFHPDIASLFAPGALTIKPRWIETDDVNNEMFGLIRDILAFL